jgi:outer membrane protein assembly factor BamB
MQREHMSMRKWMGLFSPAVLMAMLLVLTLLGAGASTATAQDGEGTATFHGNPARTGEQPGPGPSGDPTVAWRFKTGDAVRSSPVISNGTLFIGSSDANVYALDPETGDEIWRFATGGPVVSTPTVAGGVLYVGSTDGYVYAVSADTGDEVWRFYAGYPPVDAGSAAESDRPRSTITASPAVIDRVVYVTTNDFTLHAIDAGSGIERWHGGAQGQTVTSPAVADGRVFVGSEFGLVAFDAETGAVVWDGTWFQRTEREEDEQTLVLVDEADERDDVQASQERAESEAEAEAADGIITVAEYFSGEEGDYTWNVQAAPVVVDGLVYAVGFARAKQNLEGEETGRVGGVMLILEEDNGNVIGAFNFKAYDLIYTTPAVVDGSFYLGTDLGFVYGGEYSQDAGALETWGVPTERYVRSSPAVAGDTVYAANESGTIYAFNADGGQQLWRFETGGAVRSSPLVLNGLVYVGSDDGYVYAIGGS